MNGVVWCGEVLLQLQLQLQLQLLLWLVLQQLRLLQWQWQRWPEKQSKAALGWCAISDPGT